MRLLSVSLMLCVSLTAIKAENGRDFAGQYALSDVMESNGMVSATLTVRLHNYSGHDIQGARLLLHAGAPETVLADNIALANHAHKVVHAKIAVKAEEFNRWQRRGPMLTVECKDADDIIARRPVELIRALAIPEEQ
jgi:hypothetical protein